MGAWGSGSFENDGALDWIGDLVESRGPAPIIRALEAILSKDCPESPECEEAIAACELLAAMLGKPSPDLPEEAAEWIKGKPAPPAEIVAKASAALDRIVRNSEMKDLWEEAGSLGEWTPCVAELKHRLA